jgi:hypothetical protein
MTLPDDDAGRADLIVALDHIVRRPDASLCLKKWVASWAPWVGDDELEDMINGAGRTWTATDLGTHLGLTDDERSLLKITTIAPCGLSEREWKEVRKARKRERDRDAKRRKRWQLNGSCNLTSMPEGAHEHRRSRDLQSLLPQGWISARHLTDLAMILPGLCDLQPASRRRAINRAINDLADANVIEIKRGPRGSRLIRDMSSNC